jgi:hypothetical protein
LPLLAPSALPSARLQKLRTPLNGAIQQVVTDRSGIYAKLQVSALRAAARSLAGGARICKTLGFALLRLSGPLTAAHRLLSSIPL